MVAVVVMVMMLEVARTNRYGVLVSIRQLLFVLGSLIVYVCMCVSVTL